VTAIEIRTGEHAMLRRARLWHGIAAEFTRLALHLPVSTSELDAVLSRTTEASRRTLL
jgi:hypothetical protein